MGSLFPIYFNVSQFFSTLVNNLRRGFHLLLHYAKVIARYIYRYLVLAYRYLVRFYNNFQKDPITSLQFIGSMLILVNNGVL